MPNQEGISGAPVTSATRLRRIKVATSESYIYDPAKVQALYDELQPDSREYGDDPLRALLDYLGTDCPYGATVFESVGDFDQWLMEDDDADA